MSLELRHAWPIAFFEVNKKPSYTSTYHIYVNASKTPWQTYPAGLKVESPSTSIMCGCVRVRVCVQGSSTRKTLVCASSESSRESVRYLESALICPKFQNLCLFVTCYLQIGTHLNIHSFQFEVLGFQTFQSELSVVWAKRSLVANKIESKSYYSPLTLHSVRFKLQKYVIEYTKTSVSLRRFFWVPTKHCILRKIPYSKSNVSYILFDICGCFDVPGFEL